MTFQIGDRVEWDSQSNGRETLKAGVVERVVRAGEQPPPMSKNRHPGGPRDDVSYLVRVKGKGLYWPRAAALRLVPSPSGGGEKSNQQHNGE